MNTIKFSKIDNLTTEQHNLEIIDMYDEEIFNNKIKMYHPCNLNLFITNICHNKCGFCINNNFTNTDIDDETYFNTLTLALENLKEKDIEITITGGEPTLNKKRFVETIKLCNDNNFKCRTVSTTGLMLNEEYKGVSLAKHLIDNNFIHNINISRMAIDQEANDKIFKNKNITNLDIEKLAYFFKLNNAEMRISCNLMKESINNLEKMLEFISFYKNIGVDTIMFRELVGQDEIKLKDILDFKDFTYIETLHGVFYDVDIYTYQDMLVKHYITRKDIPKDVIYSISLRNGILCDNFSGKKLKVDLKGLI